MRELDHAALLANSMTMAHDSATADLAALHTRILAENNGLRMENGRLTRENERLTRELEGIKQQRDAVAGERL